MNVQQAESVITILEKYKIDTTACQATLTTISGKRSALETALTARDQAKLKTVNAELKTLWQQFRKEIRDAVRDHSWQRGSRDSRCTLFIRPGNTLRLN